MGGGACEVTDHKIVQLTQFHGQGAAKVIETEVDLRQLSRARQHHGAVEVVAVEGYEGQVAAVLLGQEPREKIHLAKGVAVVIGER